MIVPRFWAEARLHSRVGTRRVTVRRFGFSDESPEAAQAHADARVEEAHRRVLGGETLPRRERRRAYAGTDGLPIREEIVERHGDVIITRNSYGARCLNVRDVLFVDIDLSELAGEHTFIVGSCLAVLFCALASIAVGFAVDSWKISVVCMVVGIFVGPATTRALISLSIRVRGGVDAIAQKRIHDFSATHPDWHLRVYRTPAGYRVLVMHRTFDALEPAVAECFEALGADPAYVRMCRAQRCFRARISPKPWRIGEINLSRLTRAVWPISPSIVPMRERWIAKYEAAAQGYASCKLVESLGRTRVHEAAERVRVIHDASCRALESLPIA